MHRPCASTAPVRDRGDPTLDPTPTDVDRAWGRSISLSFAATAASTHTKGLLDHSVTYAPHAASRVASEPAENKVQIDRPWAVETSTETAWTYPGDAFELDEKLTVAGCVDPDRAQTERELTFDLGPEHRRFGAVGLCEVVGQLVVGAREEALSEPSEGLGKLPDQLPRRCSVAGHTPAGVRDADADVAHLVPHRQPLRLAQARKGADAVELAGDKRLVGAPDRPFCE